MELTLDKSIKSVTSIEQLDEWHQRGLKDFPLGDENFIKNTIPVGNVTHSNYLTYLEMCWKKHFNAVIRPDFIWQVIACEIGIHIKDNAEKYRSLFTDSDVKKEISVQTADPVVLPIDDIIDRLFELVPFDATAFMPEFTTTTQNSRLAFGAALCDAMSPYYNYSMYLCGIPKIKLEGTRSDWEFLLDSFNTIAEVLDIGEYHRTVNHVLEGIIDSFSSTKEDNINFFNEIISIDKCGSGSEYLATGWITKLFMKYPSLAKTQNFSSCISDVEYKNLSTNKNYIMKVGLFSSEFDGEYLVPDFSYVIYENEKD
jgi:hypothetical protein